MGSCSKHKTEIEGFTLAELATEIGDLRYDSLCKFLDLLSEKIRTDGAKDKIRKRVFLASSLNIAQSHIENASHSISDAWDISKPHMDIPLDKDGYPSDRESRGDLL